jgi:hypothetical protein
MASYQCSTLFPLVTGNICYNKSYIRLRLETAFVVGGGGAAAAVTMISSSGDSYKDDGDDNKMTTIIMSD